VSALGRLVAVHDKTTTDGSQGSPGVTTSTDFLHGDHLSSIAAVTGRSGEFIESSAYDAFGRRRNPDGSALSTADSVVRKGFTGHDMLNGLGLVHMGLPATFSLYANFRFTQL
jgi:hypothetical protein